MWEFRNHAGQTFVVVAPDLRAAWHAVVDQLPEEALMEDSLVFIRAY